MKLCAFFVFLFLSMLVYGQSNQDVTSNQKKKTAIIAGTGVALYSGTMIGLNELWYKDYPRSSFHSFNDNQQWLQMDKMGHVMTSYYVGLVSKESFEYIGMEKNKALAWGGCTGLFFLTGIEVLDGFSKEWGFSWGDQIANTAGAGLYIGQELLWEDQRVKLKFSYSHSPYAAIHPDLLGAGTPERILKDYNGQTYWLSANIRSFIPNENTRFPDWLNVALGYGADGMLGGRNNDDFPDYAQEFKRSREFYLSLDIDLSRIESKSKFFNTFKQAFGFIKIPAPALEISTHDSAQFHWLFF